MQAQGDVLMFPVAELPANLVPVARDNGRIVLAYGEHTGHAHAIHAPECEMLVDPNRSAADIVLNVRFLRVMGGLVAINPASIDYNDDGTCDVTTESGLPFRLTRLQAHGMEIGKEKVFAGVAVQHEEHYREVIAPGTHRVQQQREHSPAEIVRVAD
jgi:hypothetical protein